jgi:hypothetical protein
LNSFNGVDTEDKHNVAVHEAFLLILERENCQIVRAPLSIDTGRECQRAVEGGQSKLRQERPEVLAM